jgi:hypothetical protein
LRSTRGCTRWCRTEAGVGLRAIALDDEVAARGERRLANRLRAGLLVFYPAAVGTAGGDVTAAVFLKLTQRSPSAAELVASARTRSSRWPREARLAGSGRR